METRPRGHPSVDLLIALASGKLDEGTAERVFDHLDNCMTCREAATPLGVGQRTLFTWSEFPAGNDSLIPQTTPADSARPLASAEGGVVPNLPVELRNHPEYEVIALLGAGGMGEVYLAEHRLARQRYVLKVIHTQLRDKAGVKERFLREIRTAVSLGSHNNIATAHPPLEIGALLVLVMEYVPGQDLDKVVQTNGPLPVGNACNYVAQVAIGLQHSFVKKMVHRDIKPSNLMLSVEAGKHTVKILDFGLAKANREESSTVHQLTVPGQLGGTHEYMAPEQALDAASVDIRADIYSLGCTLYFLLAGRPPFAAPSIYALAIAHASQAVTPLNELRSDVPVQLAAVVAKMIAKSPAERYQTPEEVTKALEPFGRILKQLTVTSPPGRPVEAARSAPLQRSVAVSDSDVAKPRAPIPPPIMERRPAAARRTSRLHGDGEGKGRGMFTVVLGLVALVLLGVAVLVAASVFRGKTAEGTTNPGSGALFAAVTGKPPETAKKPETYPGSGVTRRTPDTLKNPETRKDSPATDGETELAFTYVIDGVEKKGKCRVLTLDIGRGQKMEFVRIKADSFLMGAPAGEKEASEDEKQHRVRITRDFYLGRTAVTQDQYEALMSKNPSSFKGNGLLPVETVSWNDAVAFCTALGKKTGRKVRLPWEAEWEYACRAGTTTPFHFGGKLSGDLANCNGEHPYGTDTMGTFRRELTPVGLYPANPWGLLDMHGNVYQWCGDYYGPYKDSEESDPARTTKYDDKDLRVLRGGSWLTYAKYCRSALRNRDNPANRSHNNGFRVCLPLD